MALQTPGPRGTGLKPVSGLLSRFGKLAAKSVLAKGLAGVLERAPVATLDPHRPATQVLPELDSSPAPVTEPAPATDSTDSVWVFSYASHMCWETVNRKGVVVQGRDPAFVTDPDVRMVFKHRGGQATLERLQPGTQARFQPPRMGSAQPCVHGVLYRMPASDLRYFQSRDYVVTQMEVETYAGLRVNASVFVSAPLATLPQEVTPPESYMRKLRDGAADNYLEPMYQGWLSAIPTVTSAGLGSEYWNTPARYLSYSFLLVALVVIGGYVSQHLA